ncbi:hypothetical protein AAMO2058_000001000 [Amorphochlora amoebiformis]
MSNINTTYIENQINAAIAAHLQNEDHVRSRAVDALWALLAATLVFVMQLGFGLLEAGSIQSINSQSILFKNLLDVAIVTLGWWAFGFSIAANTGNGFSGDGSNVFAYPGEEYIDMFFSWTFAATSATIVSGAVSGRMRLRSYLCVSTMLGWIIFPLFSHWAWADNGWLYERGFIDFAGSGVVHLGGGVAALVASCFTGPRAIRFEYNTVEERWIDYKPRGHSIMMSFLGTMLLWFGWFGFNAGSTLGVTGENYIVSATCLFNTSLATSSSVIGMTLLGFTIPGGLSMSDVLNSALAGLVAITAGCATMTAWGSLLAGLFAAPLYKASSLFMAKLRIDDPVDAISVHGTCGILGLLLPAFFSDQVLIDRAYGDGQIEFNVGDQLGIQIAGMIAMSAFTGFFVAGVLIPWVYCIPGGIRISERDELVGQDFEYFGGYAYPDWEETVRNAHVHNERRAEVKIRKELQAIAKSQRREERRRRRSGSRIRKESQPDMDVFKNSNKKMQAFQPTTNPPPPPRDKGVAFLRTSSHSKITTPKHKEKKGLDDSQEAIQRQTSTSDGKTGSKKPTSVAEEILKIEAMIASLRAKIKGQSMDYSSVIRNGIPPSHSPPGEPSGSSPRGTKFDNHTNTSELRGAKFDNHTNTSEMSGNPTLAILASNNTLSPPKGSPNIQSIETTDSTTKLVN